MLLLGRHGAGGTSMGTQVEFHKACEKSGVKEKKVGVKER